MSLVADSPMRDYLMNKARELTRSAVITRIIILRIEDEANILETLRDARHPEARRPLTRKIKEFDRRRKRYEKMLDSIGVDLEILSEELGLEHKGSCLDCLAKIQESFEINGGYFN